MLSCYCVKASFLGGYSCVSQCHTLNIPSFSSTSAAALSSFTCSSSFSTSLGFGLKILPSPWIRLGTVCLRRMSLGDYLCGWLNECDGICVFFFWTHPSVLSVCSQSAVWWSRWPMGRCLALWAEAPPGMWSKLDAASPLHPVSQSNKFPSSSSFSSPVDGNITWADAVSPDAELFEYISAMDNPIELERQYNPYIEQKNDSPLYDIIW